MKTICVTADIFLKPISPEDTEVIFTTIDRERQYLGKWLPFVEHTKDAGDTLRFIEYSYTLKEGPADIIYTIRYQGCFAGLIGYKFTDVGNSKTEIGYWLSEGYQGKGIITQSVRAMIKQAFEEWGFHRIQICVAKGNYRSKKIPRKLGFTFEGIARDAELLSNGYTDIEIYSLLLREWKG